MKASNTYLNAYDILANNFDSIANTAALMGVDWSAHANSITFPSKLSAAQTKTLDKAHKGRCGIIADIGVTPDGREYPVLVFNTFKHGHEPVVWSGLAYLTGKQQAYSAQELADRKAKREQAQAEKDAQEAAQRLSARDYSLTKWEAMPTATQSDYLDRKHLSEYAHMFRAGTDKNGSFIAHPLFNADGQQVGFERIFDKGGKKVSAGCGGNGFYYGIAYGESEEPSAECYITEGYADALSINKATGADCYAAISSSNLAKLAQHIISVCGYEKVIIAADNDQAGLKGAIFEPENGWYTVVAPTVLKDFNDVLVQGGVDAVREQLNNVVYSRGTYVENNQYFKATPHMGAINILVAEKGVGKTTKIREFISNHPFASILVVAHRKALGMQIAKDYGLTYYEDVKEATGRAGLNNQHRLVTSPESLEVIDASKRFDFIILDEAEQLVDHATHSTTMNNLNRANTERLRALCCNAGTIILSDADASQGVSELAKIINEQTSKPIISLKNTYKPRLIRGDNVTLYGKEETLIAKYVADVKTGEGVVFLTDSKAAADRAAALAEQHGKTLLVTSDTSNSHSLGLGNINHYVKDYKYVVYSPAMGTGFSVDEGHGFKRAYCIFKGKSITAESASQMLARFRGLGEYHAFIGDHFGSLPTSTSAIEKLLITKPTEYTFCQLGIDRTGNVQIDDFAKLWMASESIRNLSTNDFKSRLLEVLENEGFTIGMSGLEAKLDDDSQLIIDDLKEAKKIDKEQQLSEKAEAFAYEHHLDQAEALEIVTADKKTKVLKRGVNAVSVVTMDAQQARRADAADVAEFDNGERSSIELSHYAAKRKVLVTVSKLIGFNPSNMQTDSLTWDKSSKALTKKIKALEPSVYSLFRVKLNTKDHVKAMKQLVGLYGLDVKCKQSDAGERTYSIDNQSIEILKRCVELKRE